MPHLFRYAGGKVRQSKRIAAILSQYRSPGQLYVEPFLGAGSVFTLMDNPRVGYDIHRPLVAYYHAIQAGWLPPEEVTFEQYDRFMNDPEEFSLPMQAFMGFACSFGGIWRKCFARGVKKDGEPIDYVGAARRATTKAVAYLEGAAIGRANYLDLHFEGAVIYCDPPYDSFLVYGDTPPFSIEEFWGIMHDWAKHNCVFVTVNTPPPDGMTTLLHEFTTTTALSSFSIPSSKYAEALYLVNTPKIGG